MFKVTVYPCSKT